MSIKITVPKKAIRDLKKKLESTQEIGSRLSDILYEYARKVHWEPGNWGPYHINCRCDIDRNMFAIDVEGRVILDEPGPLALPNPERESE